jgi:hypothetical protein
MWMCRQVAKALAENKYYELPTHRRLGLRLHVFLCGMCGKFHRDVMTMQDGIRGFLEHEEKDDVPTSVELPEDARQRIAQNLREVESSK